MFFKRLSRSRSNSQSYVDNNYNNNTSTSPHDSKTNSASYDDKYSVPERYSQSQQHSPQTQEVQHAEPHDQRPPSSRHSNSQLQSSNNVNDSLAKETGMYARTSQPHDISSYDGQPTATAQQPVSNGYSASRDYSKTSASAPLKQEHPPDLLMQAFNQALRPYTDKVESLESENADLRAYIDQLEAHRGEVHAWIDKRGLRPDVPPSIARQMDASSHESSPTHAAATLNAQLDRKITIVNFDLHRLQDDLNDSLPTPSFSACMLKFLPDIERLSALASGPHYAFDLLLKLGGNLNSHGGLENGDEEDLAERRSFYARLDDAMVDVVRGRLREEGNGWGVQREIKRIEKTGAYLRNWGVEPYFPRTLEVMREGSGQQHAVGGATEQQQQQQTYS
ncbi:hypothetical protein AMS68_006187 [Peltaster fructicola]|uniref:Uncharacterized protein n=1 Tax=Peltaster fructicola TaxID=286661 RepID=A0A6H0Y203_9PEZI|nr:hypothetical protein AMS68_006187 [Peltaster fructicola]